MQIICVDPDLQDIVHLSRDVKQMLQGTDVHCCRSSGEALKQARTSGCDVLLTEIDLNSAQTDGFDLAKQVAEINPMVNIIFVTESMDNARAKLALDLHASGYVSKPFDRDRLAEQFRNLRHAAV